MWNGKGKEESKMKFKVSGPSNWVYSRVIYCNKKNTEIGVGRSSLAENVLYLGWLPDSKVEIS